MKIALIGMTGCGKSTVGVALAKELGYAFADVDRVIEAREGDSVANIFAQRGEAAFRDAETAALDALLSAEGNAVLACGGGIVLREENRKMLDAMAFVVLLTRPPEVVLTHPEVVNRPPINGEPQKYRELLAQRQPLYLAAAQLEVDAMDVETAVGEITKKFHV
ncbi:MAG: shikimate kinase [Oscillospiraceae bacterium]|nr:shikimate kinase [Oscillospiraceae bacterium]